VLESTVEFTDEDYMRQRLARVRELDLRTAGVPREYWNANWNDYRVNDVTTELLDGVRGWTEAYLDTRLQRPGRGVLLAGPPGIGKTRLVATAGRYLIDALGRKGVRFIGCAEYVRRTTQQFSLQTAMSHFDDVDAALEWRKWNDIDNEMHTKTPVLVLDDIGKEYATSSGFAANQMHALLREREAKGLPTLATTNVPVTGWVEAYGESMASFVYQAFAVVVVQAEDQR